MFWIWANEKFWMYSPRRTQLGGNNISTTKSHSYRLERDMIDEKLMSHHLFYESVWVGLRGENVISRQLGPPREYIQNFSFGQIENMIWAQVHYKTVL